MAVSSFPARPGASSLPAAFLPGDPGRKYERHGRGNTCLVFCHAHGYIVLLCCRQQHNVNTRKYNNNGRKSP